MVLRTPQHKCTAVQAAAGAAYANPIGVHALVFAGDWGEASVVAAASGAVKVSLNVQCPHVCAALALQRRSSTRCLMNSINPTITGTRCTIDACCTYDETQHMPTKPSQKLAYTVPT
jgi:hypothetical protein